VKAENLARDTKSAKEEVKPEVEAASEEPVAE